MSATLRTRRASTPKSHGVPTSLLLCIFLLLVVATGAFYAFGPPSKQLDSRGCAVGGSLPGSSFVLVDTTDPLTPNQVSAVAKLLQDESALLPAGGLLSVASLGDAWNGLWNPRLEACRPPRTVTEDNGGATERGLERAYRQRFQSKLDELVASMGSAHEAGSSPVFEAVAVGAAAERRVDVAADSQRRLVLITDALESVPGFPEAANAKLTSRGTVLPFFQRIHADLSGLRVSVFYLQRQRAKRMQTPGHRDFVAAWLRGRGAFVDSVTPLPP